MQLKVDEAAPGDRARLGRSGRRPADRVESPSIQILVFDDIVYSNPSKYEPGA